MPVGHLGTSTRHLRVREVIAVPITVKLVGVISRLVHHAKQGTAVEVHSVRSIPCHVHGVPLLWSLHHRSSSEIRLLTERHVGVERRRCHIVHISSGTEITKALHHGIVTSSTAHPVHLVGIHHLLRHKLGLLI